MGILGVRPKRTERQKIFEQACREQVVDLLPDMVKAVQDDSVSVRERTQLFDLLASHGFGRPVDRLAIQSLNSNAEATQLLPKEVLERRVSAFLYRSDIDAGYEEVHTNVDTAVVSA